MNLFLSHPSKSCVAVLSSLLLGLESPRSNSTFVIPHLKTVPGPTSFSDQALSASCITARDILLESKVVTVGRLAIVNLVLLAHRKNKKDPVLHATATLLENQLLDKPFVDWDTAVGRLVNPTGKRFRVIAGAAGVDISRIWLETRFTDARFLNDYDVSETRLKEALEKWKTQGFQPTGSNASDTQFRYRTDKRATGYSNWGYLWNEAEANIMIELHDLGINPHTIKIGHDRRQRPRLRFTLTDGPRAQIVFYKTNLEKPDTALDNELAGWADAYQQKAGQFLIRDKKYLARVALWLRPTGVAIIDPFTPDNKRIDVAANLGNNFYDSSPMWGEETSAFYRAVEEYRSFSMYGASPIPFFREPLVNLRSQSFRNRSLKGEKNSQEPRSSGIETLALSYGVPDFLAKNLPRLLNWISHPTWPSFLGSRNEAPDVKLVATAA